MDVHIIGRKMFLDNLYRRNAQDHTSMHTIKLVPKAKHQGSASKLEVSKSNGFPVVFIVLPDHQPQNPLSERESGDNVCLHSLGLNFESGPQELPSPGYEHKPRRQLFHY